MPFKSESQHRKFRVLLAKKKISPEMYNHWMEETKKKAKNKKHPIKELPERVKQASKEVAAIAVIKDGKVLMGKRKDSGKMTNPGGHLEKGETPVQGAVRELKEETDIDVKESDLEFVKTLPVESKGLTIHGYVYHVKGEVSPTPENDPDDEVYSWKFVDPSTLKDKELHVSRKDNVLASVMPGFETTKTAESIEGKELYKPKPSTKAGKKYMVYVKGPNGTPRLIHFGATGYSHNYSEDAKKNFRSRHGCDMPGVSKDSPKWWACNYLWNKKQEIGSDHYSKVAQFVNEKLAGGPGSGVSGKNTEIITQLETSPLISIGYRKKFMDDHKPIRCNVEIKVSKIKYKGQEKCVPKKLNRMVEQAKEDDSLFDKPIKVLRDDNGNYHVIDGHHRALAAIELDREMIKADVWVINSGEKKLASVRSLPGKFKNSFMNILMQERENPQYLTTFGYDSKETKLLGVKLKKEKKEPLVRDNENLESYAE